MPVLYVVLNDTTLGYVEPGIMSTLGVLAGESMPTEPSVQRVLLTPADRLRVATPADFDKFGIPTIGRVRR